MAFSFVSEGGAHLGMVVSSLSLLLPLSIPHPALSSLSFNLGMSTDPMDRKCLIFCEEHSDEACSEERADQVSELFID
jgi:hypothetical protein